MGKMQRNKGASFEREIVNLLIDAGFNASRNLSQTRDGGFDVIVNGVDVAIECKRAAKPLFNGWWQQTVDQAGNLHPILIYKLDRQQIRARVMLNMIDAAHSEDHVIEVGFETLIYLMRELIKEK